MSSPPSSAAVTLSWVSAPVTRTIGLRPEMTAVAPSEPSVTLSASSVPSAITRSIARSAVPSNAARFTATVFMSVPARFPVTTSSVPPSARIAAASTLPESSVMLAMLRNTVTRGPLASSVIFSPAPGAVEVERVGAAVALDDVGPVARIPLHVVVAGTAVHRVDAAVAVHEVVAGPAEHRVPAVAAAHAVVAGAAVERQRGERAEAVARAERVVAGRALDEQALDRATLKIGAPVAYAVAVVPLGAMPIWSSPDVPV